MVKKDIIRNISSNLGIDEEDIKVIVDSFMREVNEGIGQGENIYLRGFGTFSLKSMKSKIGQDMIRGEQIIIPAQKKLYFKAGKELQERIKKL
jgi:DNA-binding protein HU-beta|tara:strand:- start:2584 stop:2862 length:279 start_codon:yes stop_codon:yes gene_type:complete